MKAAAPNVEHSISVLASAVDKIEMAGNAEKDKDVISDAKSIVLAAAAVVVESEKKQKVMNATHSALTRISTR